MRPRPFFFCSVDSMNLHAGGHLTVYIDSAGPLMVRHQTEISSIASAAGTIKPAGSRGNGPNSRGHDGSVTSVLNGQTIAEVIPQPFSLARRWVEPMLLGRGPDPIGRREWPTR